MPNILICDDEPNIVDTVSDILSDEGYTIFKSESGFKALNICKENDIDAAIIDIWMPVLSGVDLLIMLKKVKPETEVIIISGHGNVEMALQALKLGAFDYIEKPLSLNKLLNVVSRALRHKNNK